MGMKNFKDPFWFVHLESEKKEEKRVRASILCADFLSVLELGAMYPERGFKIFQNALILGG